MWKEELKYAENLVREAGKILMRFYESNYEINTKKQNEPVTQADKASNEFITTQLQKNFPDYGILAEESKDDFKRLILERVWLVDPMDGTREFIDKIGQFSVMIGLVEKHRPVLGVVFQPTTNKLYSAVKNQGAYLTIGNERTRLRVSDVEEITKMRLVVSRSHRAKLVDAMKEALGIQQEVSSGSVGLKVGLLAEAQSDLYLHPNSKTKEWDTCAPDIILQEAGGIMTDLWGEPLQYNKQDVYNRRGFIASNGRRHFEIVERIQPFLNQLT